MVIKECTENKFFPADWLFWARSVFHWFSATKLIPYEKKNFFIFVILDNIFLQTISCPDGSFLEGFRVHEEFCRDFDDPSCLCYYPPSACREVIYDSTYLLNAAFSFLAHQTFPLGPKETCLKWTRVQIPMKMGTKVLIGLCTSILGGFVSYLLAKYGIPFALEMWRAWREARRQRREEQAERRFQAHIRNQRQFFYRVF